MSQDISRQQLTLSDGKRNRTSPAQCQNNASDEIQVDTLTLMRYKRNTSLPSDKNTRGLGNEFIPIKDISDFFHSRKLDLYKKWWTTGVVMHKSDLKKSKTGIHYLVLTVHDLEKSNIRVLVFQPACHAFAKVPFRKSVVSLLKPSTMKPSEPGASPALSIKELDQIMILGTSPDADVCKGVRYDQTPCERIIDIRRGKYCSIHLQSLYKKARLNRQEFASGDALFSLGQPGKQQKSTLDRLGRRTSTVSSSSSLEKETTFVFSDGSSVAMKGNQSIQRSPIKPTSQRVFSEKENQLNRLLMAGKTPGAKCLRALHGVAEPETKVNCVFGPNAIRKMGQNPLLPTTSATTDVVKMVMPHEVNKSTTRTDTNDDEGDFIHLELDDD